MGPFLAHFRVKAKMAPLEIRKADLKSLFGFLDQDSEVVTSESWSGANAPPSLR
jgi:hypothetical protein